ncbi:lysophospholipid acyltransferase family protein [Magnetococcales bacterium HHB-1]
MNAAQRKQWLKKLEPIIPYLLVGIISLMGYTLRFQWRGVSRQETTALKKPVIHAFWHARIFLLTSAYLRLPHQFLHQPMQLLISLSRDGTLLSKVVERLGFQTIRGSSHRGGIKALYRLASKINQGYDGGITPDGPKGPAEEVKIGAILLARRTGRLILPLTAAPTRMWRLKSWDRFIIPKPFSRVIILCGQPIAVPKDANETMMEQLRQQLQQELQRINKEADRYFQR